MAFPDGWGRKCELVIQHGQVSATLSNFPALVTKDTLPSEIFDADGSYPALNGGGDIRFSSNSDGSTQLACEIEQFITDNDPANGKAAIWVNVPSVASAANTSIFIWYNKAGESQPAEGATYGKHAVWDSNYKLVQHMNQDPSGSAPQMIDSTSNNNDGTSNGTMITADLIDGKIGDCLDFDGSNDYINYGSGTTIKPLQITVSGWVKGVAGGANDRQFAAMDDGTNRNWQFRSGTNGGSNPRFLIFSSGAAASAQWSTTLTNGQWYYFTGTFDKTNLKLYVDGDLKATTGKSGNLDQDNTALNVGRMGDGSHYVKGGIDEIRLSDIPRSAGWITTEYNNQNSPATFIIEGTPSTPGGGPAVNAPTGIFYGPLYGPFMGPIG